MSGFDQEAGRYGSYLTRNSAPPKPKQIKIRWV